MPATARKYSVWQRQRWRQAITKHLRVLENVGFVHSVCAGRENLFEFDPQPLTGIKEYLDSVSEQWDQALSRLKSVVED